MGEVIGITGAGVLCAIGNDKESVLASLRGGKSGVKPQKYLHTVHKEFPVGEVGLSDDEMKSMLGIGLSEQVSRTVLLGALAIREAMTEAGEEKFRGRRVAIVSGTTVGGMDVTEKYFERMKTEDGLLGLPQDNCCGQSTVDMARLAGIPQSEACTISTACSSALNAIIVGSEMLRHDEADIVLAGGSEALSNFHFNGFRTLMILDRERCRPFDGNRAGLNLGEGAAFVVLERNPDAPLAVIAGYGNRCDAFHQTASSPDGDGAFLAMSDALEMASLPPSAVSYVNAHGTGTPDNDLSESRAIMRVFGDDIPPVSSTKAFTGHTTSASGSIETVICILALRHGFVPANLGWSVKMQGGIVPTCGISDTILENVMCNSFGFGGNDSSLILTSRHASLPPLPSGRYGFVTAGEASVESVDELDSLKEFIPPLQTRRMGKLLKAAQLSSIRALKAAGVERPDAVITATSRGMLEVSQKFLDDINATGEGALSPTLFMQSTHNTVGSSIAIRLGCKGYNITYSQGDESLEWAMRDAARLLGDGRASCVLVGLYDESTPLSDSFVSRKGGNPLPEILARSYVLMRK